MTLQPGQTLLHYRLVDKIGEGGMGVVWKAIDTSLNREVAIKVLPEEVAAHPDRLARFSREARLLASLNDPHIASVYGLHEDSGLRFLAMELVPGEDLSTRLLRGPMPLDEVLAIARQLASALAGAHECGVIHRDLKPANIRLDPSGKAKVLDFGLAKALADDAEASDRSNSLSPTLTVHATAAGVIMGTAAYMSPEQARGKPVTRTTDIWAFGCVVYEMLTGSRAFAGETVTDIIAHVVTREPDWQALPAGTPASVRRLLRRCLAKDPAARLQHAGDACLELDEAAAGQPADELGAPAGGAAGSGAGRRSGVAPAWAAALAVTALALGWAGARWLTPAAAPATTTGDAPVIRLQMELDRALDTSGLPRRVVAISPDGTRLVYAGQEQGRSRLFLREMSRTDSRPIPGSEGGLTPFFSPDGRSVAFYAGGKLKQISLSGGSPLELCDVVGLFYGGTWAEDDTIFFSSSQSMSLQAVPAHGGKVEEIEVDRSGETIGPLLWPEVLPGGEAALVTLSPGPGLALRNRIAVVELGSGRLHVLDRGSDARYLSGGRVIYTQGSDLLAAPYDEKAYRLTGTAVSLSMDTRSLLNLQGGVPGLAVSRSGTLIFAGPDTDPASELVWVSRQGHVETALSEAAVYSMPHLASDGRRIASWLRFTRNGLGDIWVSSLDGTPAVRLTTDQSSAYPLWAPDEKSIFYISARSGNFQVYRKRADGSGQAELALEGPNARVPLSFSPDGKTALLYEVNPETQRDIWMWPLDGEPQPLLVTPYNERAPQMSPDGRYFAYVSNESGRDEVYVRRFPDDGSRWAVSTGGGSEPLWNPDGSELFYRHELDMMAVPVTLGASFQPGRPVKLFDGLFTTDPYGNANYDVSDGGQRFLMVAGQTIGNTKLDVVLNWTTEVERVLEGKR